MLRLTKAALLQVQGGRLCWLRLAAHLRQLVAFTRSHGVSAGAGFHRWVPRTPVMTTSWNPGAAEEPCSRHVLSSPAFETFMV